MNEIATARTGNVQSAAAASIRSYPPETIGRHHARAGAGIVPALRTFSADAGTARHAVGALRAREQHCAAIIDATMDAIIAIDQDHQITLFNRAAQELFRCTADDAVDQPVTRFVPVRMRGLLRECLQGAVVARQRWMPAELSGLRADGAEFPIEGTISPARIDGRMVQTIILRETTARANAHPTASALFPSCVTAVQNTRPGRFWGVVGEAPAMRAVFDAVNMVAKTDSTVLINGETGTGKELIARAIHEASERRARPLITVNCAALPGELIESELFGHEKGAFTGATAQRRGRFELADGGTIFLDEVGELSAQAQPKLLRVLQEQTFERVGGGEPIKVNVRVIAATNRDLAQMVKAGTFRADLYYRLSVFPLVAPPLRERRADIALLASHFCEKYARKLGKSLAGIAPNSMERLARYGWPGNVRELQNVIERMVICACGPTLEIDEAMLASNASEDAVSATDSLHDVTRDHIERVLKDCGGVIEGTRGAAAILRLKPSTLRYRMKLLGVAKAPGRNAEETASLP